VRNQAATKAKTRPQPRNPLPKEWGNGCAPTLWRLRAFWGASAQKLACTGGPKFFEVNLMNRDSSQRLAQMNDTPRCGAKTRAGSPCRCPAMPNGKCRTHGGASPGAPRGSANGRFRDGYWTHEALEERRFIRLLLKGALNMDAKA
jgi:hypothetical protein